jgi:hypothetical protein
MQPDTIEARPYKPGDGALIPVAEPDPFGFWLREVEQIGRGMTSYYLDGLLIAVSFYTPAWDGVADSCALVNRELSKGHGKALAAAVRHRIDQLMISDNLHRAQANAYVKDRASQVFLRAIGYRYESTMKRGAADGSDLFVYALLGD